MRGEVPFHQIATATPSPLGPECSVKLYRNSDDPLHWTVYVPEHGWYRFPAAENGWDRRSSDVRLNPTRLNEVPLWLAFNTGLPATKAARTR